jgi:hypothetical protein
MLGHLPNMNSTMHRFYSFSKEGRRGGGREIDN